jgi:chaperonin GroES
MKNEMMRDPQKLNPGEEYVEPPEPPIETMAMQMGQELEESPDALKAEKSAVNQLEAYHAMANIAETLPPNVISEITNLVIDGYEVDKLSRSEWEEANSDILDLARLTTKKKTYAGEIVSNVKYPTITSAAIQFAARAYPEIVKGKDIVKVNVIGEDESGEKAARGKRLATHMSFQILNEMNEWVADVDQMLHCLPVLGCAFKKTYYDGVSGQNRSEMIFPDALVVDYYAVSLEKAARITHEIELSKNEVVERIRSGVFLDVDIDVLGVAAGEEGQTPDESTPHVFLEQHCWYDLDEDGYQEPYIVTIHRDTQTLFRISARFDLRGVELNEKGEVVRIEPTHYFTRFLFMPALDGNFYGMGFGLLLKDVNAAENAILNQLIDAGTLSNRTSGFLGRGIQLSRGGRLKFSAGEWKQVPSTGDDLRKNIVPLPTAQPSPVLFQLLGLLIQTGKDLAGMTEVLSGQSPGPNVPASTTLALIEQGLQVYSAIQRRIHRSLRAEFQKIRRLNKLFLPESDYQKVLDDRSAVKPLDYDDADLDVVPVSDLNATTNMQRLLKARSLLEMRGQGLNDQGIMKRYLETLEIEDLPEILPKEQPQDPLLELETQKRQAEIAKLVAEKLLIVEKVNTEKVLQEVRAMGTEFDAEKLKIEKAKVLAKIEEIEKGADVRAPKTSGFQGKTDNTSVQGPFRDGMLRSDNE